MLETTVNASSAIEADIRPQSSDLARFSPVPTEATLPLARPRSRAYSAKRSTLQMRVPDHVLDVLRATGVSPAAAFASAVACVLHHYTGEQRLCVGTGRPRGSAGNALPLVLVVDPEMSMGKLREAADAALAEMIDSGITLSRLVTQLGLDGITNRNPLFCVAVRDSTTQSPLGDSRCDVMLTWSGPESGLLEVEYSARLFDSGTVERFAHHTVRALASADGTPIALLDYIPAEERSRLTQLGAGPEAVPASGTVLEMFARRVAGTPAAPALYSAEADEHTWSYRQVDEISNRFAAALQARGAGRGDRIGLCLQIGPAQLMWMLGILKCAATVVPIDVTFPAFRLAKIIRNAQLSDVVAEEGFRSLLPEETRVFMFDGNLEQAPAASFVAATVMPEDPVYVLHTSGSTGRPKAVVLPHRALANLVQWQNGQSECAGRRTFHRTSLTFDVSFQEIFSTWCAGGSLVIADEAQRQDISQWPELFRRRSIARVFLPVVALHQFAEVATTQLPELKELIVAGEQLRLTSGVTRLFRTLDARLINQYGPTETHVVTSHILEGASAQWPMLPPIGRPIQNAHVWILDGRGEPVPVGVVGEICISGLPLAIGYHGEEALTRERFRPAAAAHMEGLRLYHTGDFGRFTPEGIIEFTGRRDEQVKLRGYRIELGELESTLGAMAGIRQAAATLWRDEQGEARLAAYIVHGREGGPSNAQVRTYIKERLPDYMVPSISHIIRLDALPMTPSGKVDRRNLPRPAVEEDTSELGPAADPSQALAQFVAATWARHLRAGQLHPQDGFLDLGGHSLLAIHIVSEINERLGTSVPLRELLRGPTLARFTAVVAERARGHTPGSSADPDAEDGAVHVTLPDGTRVVAPYPPEAHYLYTDIYEYRTYDQRELHYSDARVIVDAGANIGLFSLYALRRAPHSRLIAIEPAPLLWTALRENLSSYGERVLPLNLALSNRNGTAEFTYYPAIPGMSSLHPDAAQERQLLATILRNLADSGRPEIRSLFSQEPRYLEERLGSETFPCRVRRFSSLRAELGLEVIDILKIDVQKAELEVLQGIDEDDWGRIRQLVIEVHDVGGRLQEITTLLHARGYRTTLAEPAAIHQGSVVRFLYASLASPARAK
jgi:amino acid adenylation domain-containing protein/FkbM family methyltransferase